MKNRYVVIDEFRQNDTIDEHGLNYTVWDRKKEIGDSAFRTRQGARERAFILNSREQWIQISE